MRTLLTLALLCFPAVSHAQFSLETFRPAVDSKGLVTVNASETLSHLDYSIGFTGSYAYRTLSFENSAARYDVDHLVSMQLQGALGLFGGTKWYRRMHGVSLQVGASLPVRIMTGARAPGFSFSDPNYDRKLSFAGQSVGDVGLNVKVRFLDTSHHRVGLAVIGAVDFPSGGSDAFLGEGQTTFRPQVILDGEPGRARRWHLALNVGAIVRGSSHTFTDLGTTLQFGSTNGTPVPNGGQAFCAPQRSDGSCGTGGSRTLGSQLTYALGASYAVVTQRLALVAEISGAIDPRAPRSSSPLEATLAAKVYLATSSYFTIGAGAGLLPPRIADGPARGNMTGEPLFRVFLGFTFEPRVGDRDHDGIKDDVDLCPDDPETYNGFKDDDGCPDELPPPPATPPEPAPEPEPEPEPIPEPEPTPTRAIIRHGVIEIFDKVYFKTASAEILPRSFPLLDDVAKLIVGHPDIKLLEVGGHADERGNDDYNLQLTDARAKSVRKYLTEHGVEWSRLTSRGYGETQPAPDDDDHFTPHKPCREHSERCWEKNRRVEFRILVQ